MKLKKLLSLTMAAIMAVSAMSICAFAEESVTAVETVLKMSFRELQEDEISALCLDGKKPELGSTVYFTDEDGVIKEATVAGYLDISKFEENVPMPIWYKTFDDVNIPRNIDGYQGEIKGR